MRLAFDSQRRFDCLPIEEVKLNLNCRDEIIPILRALQHIYADGSLRRQILGLVGKDVNRLSSRKHGRRGLDYWSIAVLAGVRLGCNLDYDKLQDLAEQHRNLRRIMGIGDWEERNDNQALFDWRRIQDNLTQLRPETLEKINHLIVAAGHKLAPEAPKAVRGDTFVVETNIHYPTESSLIGDGLRKVVTLAAELAEDHELPGWRQEEHLLKKIKKLVRKISRVSRSKGKDMSERLQQGYRELLQLAAELLQRGRDLVATLANPQYLSLLDAASGVREKELLHYADLTTQVCDTARRRVLEGETVANEEKIFSIFEPHTELIKRGKQPNPNQFGRKALVIEDGVGFICHYKVVAQGVQDQDLVVPEMTKLQERLDGQIERASFDRGFHTPENQRELADIVAHPCIAKKGGTAGRQQQEEASVEFREARQNHPGIESAINALQCGNGQERCRDHSERGFERYVGLGVLGRNLQILGKLLLAQDDAKSQAAQSKRKESTRSKRKRKRKRSAA
jgi:transposase, IS5 family